MKDSPFRKAYKYVTDRPYRAALKHGLPEGEQQAAEKPRYYLVTATIAKGEAKYIREFVIFHRLVGVDHMLIYLDGGGDAAVEAALRDLVAERFVELIPWPRFLRGFNNQYTAYQHAVAYMRGQCRWLAMIDADEFLFAPASHDLKAELQSREQHAALAVYSRTFGTGGIKRIASGQLVTEALFRRGVDDNAKNTTQRTIVDPNVVSAIRSANSCVLKGTRCLGWDEDGKPVSATGEAGHNAARLRINHYFTRSEEDFHAKVQRRYFGKTKYSEKITAKIEEAEGGDLSAVEDTAIHHYLPALKAAVQV
jgi:Glycosyltransferase family 92